MTSYYLIWAKRGKKSKNSISSDQFGKDGRSAEELPGAHSFYVPGAGCSTPIACTPGALLVTLRVHPIPYQHIRVHPTLERMADLPKIFRVHGHFGPGARGATT